MTRVCPLGLIAILLLVVGACRGGPTVRHDLREGVDFSTYQTFQIADTAALQAEYPTVYSELVDERLRAALQAELQEQGFQPAEPGDLRVDVQLQLRSELRSSGGSGVGFGFGIGTGRVGTGVGIGTGSRRAEEEILAEVIVALGDRDSGRLLWQGGAENGLSELRRRSQSEVRAVVDTLFDQPPFAD
jgi:hypothetical protein